MPFNLHQEQVKLERKPFRIKSLLFFWRSRNYFGGTVYTIAMMTETLKTIFNRDLKRLQNEIELYENEAAIWEIQGQITNSTGNLCLHLVGNLNTYIGKELGGTNYVRNRELEFSARNVPRKELIEKIEDIIEIINQTLDNLDSHQLQSEYPILVFDSKTSTEYLLIHLTTHLAYHLGQINYHRRLTKDNLTKST